MKTDRTKQLPLFFTQVIGSLPRPQVVLDLLAKRDEMDPTRFAEVMDRMVLFAIRLQEEAGIDVISDGEWRRTHYIGELLQRIGGFEPLWKYNHHGTTKYSTVVTHKMNVREPLFKKDADFLVRNTDRVTKFALPSPFLIAVRYWHKDYSTEAYPTMFEFMDHLAEILAAEAEAVVEAGIDIVQIDDPALTYYCDPRLTLGEKIHDERLHRQWDAGKEIPTAVKNINRIVGNLKAETHVHCCHSVSKRQSDVVGSYKPLLPHLKDLKVDRLNLEFAYRETGEPDDLELLPDHLSVGMGVVDVRGERVTPMESILDRARKGAAILSPERVALNPDCGFAPDAAEPPTIDEAYSKLKQLADAAAKLREEI